jgi:hypothetical protein
MVTELERRGMQAILLSWPPHSSTECTLNAGGFTIEEAKKCLAMIGHKLLRESDPNYDETYRDLGD